MIIDVVCEEFGVDRESLLGSSRKRDISQARQIAMFLMRHHTNLSLPKIGDYFGGKDHTTVLYSCEKVSQLQRENLQFERQLQNLAQRLRVMANSRNR